jgi:iron complex outermembrane recepter protein
MLKSLLKAERFRLALAAGAAVPIMAASTAMAQVGATSPTPVPASAAQAPVADRAITDAAAAGAATTERVIVTGSYIPTAETEAALPVTVYTASVLVKQGANTPAEGLRQLPSFVGNAATENNSNGGNGVATINLRALGSGNTLTLINGRRAFELENINAIPIGALSRSEVLKDGASAIYGSDAVAGVVNFIMINGPGEAPYEGAEIDLLYGNTTDKDARVLQGWIRGGVATDKVSIAAAAEYYDRNAIMSRDREIAANADRRYLGGTNQGSPTFEGRVSARTNPAVAASNTAMILVNPSINSPTVASYREYDPNADALNFRIYTPAIPAMEKYGTFTTGRYKMFGEALQIYGDFLYFKQKQFNGLAPAPFAIGAAGSQASPYNPFPPNALQQIQYRATREGGLRGSVFDYDYYRWVVGFNGNFTFTDNSFISYLGYDTGMVYSRSDFLRVDTGDARRTPLEAEIAAGNFNPFIGMTAPTSGTATTFVAGVPTGARAYDNVAAWQRASYVGRSFSYSRDFLADAKIFGNLFPNLYQGGIGFNIGYEQRHSRFKSIPDPVQAAGNQLGFNAAANLYYHEEVKAYFGELQVPLVISSNNVPFVRSLELQVAYRFEEFHEKNQFSNATATFDNGGDVRISLRYQPIEDVTIRASFGESFLSPTAGQLFAPQTQNFPQLFDPLTGRTLQPQPGGVRQGGNPALTPEITNTYTAGIVITPRIVPGFTATVDFYQLYTKDVILPASQYAQLVLTANGLSGGTAFADLVIREPGTNLPQQITALTSNAGKRLVNGMDVTAAYQLPWTTFGTITFSLGYNYFFSWQAEAIEGLGSHTFLGDYNNTTLPLAPGALPYHKGFLRGEYAWGGLTFVATMNYISSYWDDSAFLFPASRSALVGGTPTDPQYADYRRVSDYQTLDMQLSYEFRKPEMEAATGGYSKDPKGGKSMVSDVAGVDQGSFFQRMLWGTTIRVGVVNAFDRNPPTVLGAFNDNYDTSLYTIRNRYYYIGLNKKF